MLFLVELDHVKSTALGDTAGLIQEADILGGSLTQYGVLS